MSAPILPGAMLGVLGGGQLGRMFTMAARRMGYRVAVFSPEEDSPAGQLASAEVRAAYDDLDAVARFARDVDVVTFEFENVPSATAEVAGRHAPLRPGGDLLHHTQERSREKDALSGHGIPVAPYGVVEGPDDLAAAAATTGFPAVLKTASWGYDGLGQRVVRDAAGLAAAWDELGRPRAVLEQLVDFEAELSVVGARGPDGQVALYEPTLNRHASHILDVVLCPAPLPAAVRDRAEELARHVLEAFDVVGVLCIELFLLRDGGLLVNELAPRPHNSGHVTLDAHVTCQFEQQVRAVCGLPLGSTARRGPAAVMVNLLGDLWAGGTPDWSAALADRDVRLHLYGKRDARPGRKMGHLNLVADDLEEAERRALAAREALRCADPEGATWTGA